MAVFLSPVGGVGAQFFDNNGNPLSGGKLYTYAAGTTTPQTTYTTSAGNVAHTNPIVLDSAGRVSGSSEIWITAEVVYKFVLKTQNDVILGTWDNVSTVSSASQIIYTPSSTSLLTSINVQEALDELSDETTGSAHVGFIQSNANAVARTIQSKLRDFVSVKDFGAVGDGITDDTAAIQAAIDADLGNVLFPAGIYRTTAPITMTEVTVSLYGEGKRFNIGVASEILIDHAGIGILIADKAHIGVFLQDLRFNRAAAYLTQGANISLDGNGPSPSEVVSHINMLRVHIQGGAYALLLRGVIFGAFDYVTINSSLNGVIFNGAGSTFPANNVISFSQLSISGATTAAITFQGDAGRNIMFFNCDIESSNYTIYINPNTTIQNLVFDGLWLEDNAQPIVIWSGTQLYFKHIRNANNVGIKLFDRSSLETGTASDVVVEGQYGGSVTHYLGASNVTASNVLISNVGGYSYAVTALTGSRANGYLIEPAVSGAQIMGTSVMDIVRQSGAFGKNYLINWNIPGSSSWNKTGATTVQTETDPLGGNTAYSWNGYVEGGRVTPPAIAVGQFYEMVLWAKGAGLIRLQNFGRPFYYNIDTTSWTRLVFRVKITDLSQVMDSMLIDLIPNVPNGIQIWRPGIYDVMDAIDTRPSIQQSIYEGGYIDTAYTYGVRERINIIVYGTSVPSAGDWLVGDKVMNTIPTAGGNIGWVCTTAGTPGTWKSFGAIAV